MVLETYWKVLLLSHKFGRVTDGSVIFTRQFAGYVSVVNMLSICLINRLPIKGWTHGVNILVIYSIDK